MTFEYEYFKTTTLTPGKALEKEQGARHLMSTNSLKINNQQTSQTASREEYFFNPPGVQIHILVLCQSFGNAYRGEMDHILFASYCRRNTLLWHVLCWQGAELSSNLNLLELPAMPLCISLCAFAMCLHPLDQTLFPL